MVSKLPNVQSQVPFAAGSSVCAKEQIRGRGARGRDGRGRQTAACVPPGVSALILRDNSAWGVGQTSRFCHVSVCVCVCVCVGGFVAAGGTLYGLVPVWLGAPACIRAQVCVCVWLYGNLNKSTLRVIFPVFSLLCGFFDFSVGDGGGEDMRTGGGQTKGSPSPGVGFCFAQVCRAC